MGIEIVRGVRADSAWKRLSPVPETAPRLSALKIFWARLNQGKLADMLLLGSNPLDDIGDIRDIDLVIQDGKIYERDFFCV